MKYVEKLLQGAEVEWKKLGEVAEIKRGRVISKGYLNENAGLYPVYSSQTENMGEIGRIRTFDFDQESITWTTDGAKAGTVFHRKGRFSITNVCGLIKIRDIQAIGYRYLYYWLSIEAKKHVYLGMGNPKLMSNQMERIPIPIPPLHVQQEIVRILDKFTELETELEAKLETELELRKQQYERYRDQLLSPDKGLSEAEVEWKKLGEVCQFKNGFAFKSSLFKESGLPIIRIGNIIGNSISMRDMAFFDPKDYKKGKPLSYFISKGDILIAMSGATTGKIGYYDNEELAYLNQRVGKFIPNPITLNNRFLYHFLLTQSDYFYRLSLGGAQPNLSSDDLMERVLIPIPPLHVQQEIVRILDKFHTLTTSISEGLPREIELRKQQYAYYRDQLLSFER